MNHFVCCARLAARVLSFTTQLMARGAAASPKPPNISPEWPWNSLPTVRSGRSARYRNCRYSTFSAISGLLPALTQILMLSIILQLYVLASPFYMQIVVDNAIAKDDRDLLLVLACGFALFLLINTGANLMRARLLVHAQSALAFQMGAGVFRICCAYRCRISKSATSATWYRASHRPSRCGHCWPRGW